MYVITLYEAYSLYGAIVDVDIVEIIFSSILFLVLSASLIKKDIIALRSVTFYIYLAYMLSFVVHGIIILVSNNVYLVTEKVCSYRVDEFWPNC